MARLEAHRKHSINERHKRSCYVVSFKVCVEEVELDFYVLDFF